MSDTTLIKTFQVISNSDTLKYCVNKDIVNHFLKEKPTDYSHYIEILIPVFVALITLSLTKLFDFWSEKRKYKKEIRRENRKNKIHFLKYLNKFKTSLGKTHFPDADYDDFIRWTADRMVGTNPFEDLKINSNIIFNGNNEVIELINQIYTNAESINNQFDWTNMQHSKNSLTKAEIIYNDLGSLIEKIANDLN